VLYRVFRRLCPAFHVIALVRAHANHTGNHGDRAHGLQRRQARIGLARLVADRKNALFCRSGSTVVGGADLTLHRDGMDGG